MVGPTPPPEPDPEYVECGCDGSTIINPPPPDVDVPGDTITFAPPPPPQIFVRNFMDGVDITLTDFATSVNESIDLLRATIVEFELRNAVQNKLLHLAAAIFAGKMRGYGESINNQADSQVALSETENGQIDTINTEITAINTGNQEEIDQTNAMNTAIDSYNTAANNYNQAIANYNNPAHPDYNDLGVLQDAYNTYVTAANNYNSAKSSYDAYAASRNADIAAYNASVDAYNAEVCANNELASQLNAERSELLGPIPCQQPITDYLDPLPLAPTVTVPAAPTAMSQPPAPTISNLPSRGTTGGDNDVDPADPAPTEDEIRANEQQALEEVMELPTAFLNQFATILRYSDDFKQFQLDLEASLPFVSNSFIMEEVPSFSSSGPQSRGGLKTLGATLYNAGAVEALSESLYEEANLALLDNVTAGEFRAVQAFAFEALTKLSFQGAVGPGFAVLSDVLGRSALSNTLIQTVLGFSAINRVASFVQSQDFEEALREVLVEVSQDEGIERSDAEIDERTDTFANLLRVTLTVNTLTQAGIALGATGLVGQALRVALREGGLPSELTAPSFNNTIENQASIILLQAQSSVILQEAGFTPEEARAIAGSAIANAAAGAPFASVGAFVDNLALQFAIEGISPPSAARALALEVTVGLLQQSPFLSLTIDPLQASALLGALPEGQLTSEQTITNLLSGVSGRVASGDVREALQAVLERASLDTLISLITQEALPALQSGVAPTTLEEIRNQLIVELTSRGINAEAALQIADNLTTLLQTDSAFSAALQISAAGIEINQAALVQALQARGFSVFQAVSLANAFVRAGAQDPSQFQGLTLSENVTTALDAVSLTQRGILDAQVRGIIGDSPQVRAIVDRVVAFPAALRDESRLTSALRDALLAQGFGGAEAVSVAEQIVSAEITDPQLIGRLESLGLTPTTLAAFSEEASTALLTEQLIARGIPEEQSATLAKAVAETIPVGPSVGTTLESIIQSALGGSLAQRLLLSPDRLQRIVESVRPESVIQTGEQTRALAETLVSRGVIGTDAEALATVGTAIERAIASPGALGSVAALRAALTSEISGLTGLSLAEARNLLSPELLSGIVDRGAIRSNLEGTLIGEGISAADAAVLSEIVAGSFVSEGLGIEDAFRAFLGDSLIGARSIELSVALTVAGQINLSNVVATDPFQSQLEAGLLETGLFDPVVAGELAGLIAEGKFLTAGSFANERAFISSLNDAVFLIAIDPTDLKALSLQLSLRDLVNAENLQNELEAALIAAGVPENEASALARQAAEQDAGLESSVITDNIIADLITNGTIAEGVLADSIVKSRVIQDIIRDGEIRQNEIRDSIQRAIQRAQEREDALRSEADFKSALRDELRTEFKDDDRLLADDVLDDIIVSDIVKKDLIEQNVIREAQLRRDLTQADIQKARIAADRIVREARSGDSADELKRRLADELVKEGVLDRALADEVAASVNLGIIVGGQGALFDPFAGDGLSRAELGALIKDELVNRLVAVTSEEDAIEKADILLSTLLREENSALTVLSDAIKALVEKADDERLQTLILNGVIESVTDNTILSYNAYLQEKLFQVNGMNFIDVVQQALLSNVGGPDTGEVKRSIDILI